MLHPLLHAGTQYWMVASASASPSDELGWPSNSTGDTGIDAVGFGSCSLSKSGCGDDTGCPSGETCEPDPQSPWFTGKSNSGLPRGAFRVTGLPAPTPVCGNGVTEGSEECDDGNTVDGDGCGSDCRISCDATVAKANLKIGKLNTPLGDDTLTFSGQATLPSSSAGINPLANGGRLLIHDPSGGVLELTIPAGALAVNRIGWKVNKSGTTWTWSNFVGSAPGGIIKSSCRTNPTRRRGSYSFPFTGRVGPLPSPRSACPLQRSSYSTP